MLDPDEHRVTVDGDEVTLPLKEFEVLHLLLANAGRVLTRETLIDRVWGADYVGDTKTLDVHIKRLRSKIEDDPVRRHGSSRSVDSATSTNEPRHRRRSDAIAASEMMARRLGGGRPPTIGA